MFMASSTVTSSAMTKISAATCAPLALGTRVGPPPRVLPTELLITPNDRERLENGTNIITHDTARLKPALILHDRSPRAMVWPTLRAIQISFLARKRGTLKAH